MIVTSAVVLHNLEQFLTNSVHLVEPKPKYSLLPTAKDVDNLGNQSKPTEMCASASQLILVLLLTGRKSDASF